MDTLHQLVRVVVRSFYDDKNVVILDTIVRETMIPEDILIDRMQIVIRDLNRIIAHLLKDRLIKCETKQQPRADGKIITRNFYYIDYKQFVDIVKYRIYKMRQSVEEMIKKEMESKGYICGQCKTIFNSLDVSRLLNVRTGSFDCDVCPDSELQAYDPMNISTSEVNLSTGTAKTIGGAGPHELHSRLMEQIRLIIELLKKADNITIPIFKPALWLELHGSKYSLLNTDENDEDGPQLAIAGSNSGLSNLQQSVSVELAEEGALNPASSSVSNPLPEWHMYSTVTGEAIRSSNIVVDDKSQADVLKRNNIETSIEIEANEVEDRNELLNYYTQMTAEEEQNSLSPSSKHSKLDLEIEVESKLNKFEVSIGGKLVPINQITEEDKDRMTEEEYTKYYEIYMSQLQ